MWYRYILEERLALERVLNQKCYWWVLVNTAYLCVHINGEPMKIKLPTPVIFANPKWHDEWKWKKHDDAEKARCKAMWGGLAAAIEERLKRIDAGESTIEQEFTGDILFEDGNYGLKYRGKWPL